ncbi:hypothetical protein J4H92_12845 [Leucobacter weissii]|uniref:Uncharacterized protein n=1 Tax=Leucobacter weissii TaxID=1983706 RepID=A0A939SCY5_9MICO|nr:hypothetical protein [Leucobacter weissii]MBO1902833.1 hypothetical protein [Leucobacter weissii]
MKRAPLYLRAGGVGLIVAALVSSSLATAAVLFQPDSAEAAPVTQNATTTASAVTLTNAKNALVSEDAPFPDLKVTVSQTKDLVNQGIRITWTGGKRSSRPSGSNGGENFLQIAQCWGEDKDNPGHPDRRTCQYGGTLGYGSMRDATQGRTQVADQDKRYTVAEARGRVYTGIPFVAVNSRGSVDDRKAPSDRVVTAIQRDANSSVYYDGNPGWAIKRDGNAVDLNTNTFFTRNTTNEVNWAPSSADGSGSVPFEVQTAMQSPGLGCGNVAAGSSKAQSCWLVIIPRGEKDNGSNSIDKPGIWWDSWEHHVATKLEFRPLGSRCDIGTQEQQIAGSELLVNVIASWQPQLCSGKNGAAFVHRIGAETDALRDASGTTPSALALTSLPLDTANAGLDKDPLAYAPIALSGLSISFAIDSSPQTSPREPTEPTEPTKPAEPTRPPEPDHPGENATPEELEDWEADYSQWQKDFKQWKTAMTTWRKDLQQWEIDVKQWRRDFAKWEVAHEEWESTRESWEKTEQRRGQPMTQLNLTPRLLAKLLTASYTESFPVGADTKHISGNPRTIVQDPDFWQHNGGADGEWAKQSIVGVSVSDALMPEGRSDLATRLWEYVYANAEAAAWLNGAADQWGTKVNPYYSTNAKINPTKTAFSLPRDNFPKADPTEKADTTTSDPAHGTGPIDLVINRPYTSDFTNGAYSVLRGDGKVLGDWDKFSIPNKYGKAPRQLFGNQSVIALTTAPAAEQYQTATAALLNPAGRFVLPTRAGMSAAAAAMVPDTTQPKVALFNPNSSAAKEADTAYPLTMPVYAALNPAQTDYDLRSSYAGLIRYAVQKGQRPGTDIGRLPPGYAPLSQEWVKQALAAADEIQGKAPEDEKDPDADPESPADPDADGESPDSPDSESDPDTVDEIDSPEEEPLALAGGTTPDDPLNGLLVYAVPAGLLTGLAAAASVPFIGRFRAREQ